MAPVLRGPMIRSDPSLQQGLVLLGIIALPSQLRRSIVNSMGDDNWSDWYPFEGDEIGFQAPSDEGGVYCIADSRENVVYVGRAESLLERLAEHESGSSDQSACIRNSGGKFFRFMVIKNFEERESFEGMLLRQVSTPCND